jgi:bile acid-coenzyme A ligase
MSGAGPSAPVASGVEISYPRRLRDVADAQPDTIALRFRALTGEQQAVTFGELDRRSDQLAGALVARGVRGGALVPLALRNSPELIECIVAAWKLGAVPVPLRWDLPEWELTRLLEVVGADVEIGPTDLAWIRATEDDPVPDLPDVVSPMTHGICSSGSSGRPKVILIQRPALWTDELAAAFPDAWMEVPRPQVVLVPGPMYHSNGFATLRNVMAGDQVILLEKFDAAAVVDLIEEHQVTTITATTTMLQRIADLPDIDDRDLSSLVWVLQGAAVIGASLVRRWTALVGAERFFMAYGMTEGLGLCAVRGDEWLARPGTVGRGYRETEVRILDDELKEVPRGELGTVYLRSPTGDLYEYLGTPEVRAPTVDGFATAGDAGWLDDDGYVYVTDRRADMIVTGGANVYPAEVEQALVDHPDVVDVVVIGLADPEWGRRVHAIVQARDAARPPTTESVVAFAKSRLAPYKVPKTVEVVDRIPRSEATKVSRIALVRDREP